MTLPEDTDDYEGQSPATEPFVHDAERDPFQTISAKSKTGLEREVIKSIGGFEVFGELGSGGMGVVYKARQIRLNRIVALKTIRGLVSNDSDLVSRFRLEAEASARLTHENIVPVIDYFEEDGSFYLALGYVDGVDLESKLKSGLLNCREAAKLVIQISQAIEYAHQQGVIHRDLKPANVLVDKAGICRVSDFGLAKLISGRDDLTLSGQILGTPAYMSPEQASGNSQSTSISTDVYSLGAILYRCVSGQTPFTGSSAMDVLSKVRSKNAKPPSRLCSAIDQDIDTICLKCLEKDPVRRYRSASEVANELSRYLAGEPIQARPISSLNKFVRYCKRKPAETALALAVMFVICLGTVLLSIWFAGRDSKNIANSNGLLSNTQLLVLLSGLGPVFSVCRAVGPKRLRSLETALLTATRAVFHAFLISGALVLKLALLLTMLYIMSSAKSTVDDESILPLMVFLIIYFSLILYTQWKLGLKKRFFWTLKLFGVVAVATLISGLLWGLLLPDAIHDDHADVDWSPISVVVFVLGGISLCVALVALLVAFFLAVKTEFTATFHLLDATFFAFEEGYLKTIGFVFFRYRDYRIGMLFLWPFALFLNLVLCALAALGVALFLPFWVAEHLRHLLTPKKPIFTDLLAAGVSMVTLVLLALRMVAA